MKEGYEVMKMLSIDESKKYAKDKNVVIVTGVTGQDGSFMSDYLLANTKYEVFGGARRLSVDNHSNIDHLRNEPRFHLINFDLTDPHSISQTISQLNPSYFINFAAQSFVKASWHFPAQTWETNTTALVHILEAIRLHCPECRFYNAGSSEEFGNVLYSPQDENHPMRPRSPYGASKVGARQLVKVYRESYGLYAVQGWLFNHEGTRRGEDFVTRKITKGVARIVNELKDHGKVITPIDLGNVDARRDWSDAEDMIDAVWRMLNQDKYNQVYGESAGDVFLTDFVVASGEDHTIREFVELAFECALIKGFWTDAGVETTFRSIHTLQPLSEHILVKIDPANYRPAEVDKLLGNPKQIKLELDWKPKTSFKELVRKMVYTDLKWK